MNRSVSIDDTRRNFRFGSEIAWEIRGGKRGRMLRNPTFGGRTLDVWPSCDAVGDRASFRVYGLPSCNKGEPLQVAHIGHGTVPARASATCRSACDRRAARARRPRRAAARAAGAAALRQLRITYQHSEERLTVRARRGDAWVTVGKLDPELLAARRFAGVPPGRVPVSETETRPVRTAFAATEAATAEVASRRSGASATRCHRARGSAAGRPHRGRHEVANTAGLRRRRGAADASARAARPVARRPLVVRTRAAPRRDQLPDLSPVVDGLAPYRSGRSSRAATAPCSARRR